MDFIKVNMPTDYGIRIIHCNDCTGCDEDKKQDQRLRKDLDKQQHTTG